MIPHAVPHITALPEWNGGTLEAMYVTEALANNEPTSGSFIPRFEDAVRSVTGAEHAVALSSGSAALHIALLVAGIQPGDKVIVPATTFVATANAVLQCGAEPVILDVEPDTWGLDVNRLADYLANHPVQGVLPVHLYGHPCRLDAIRGLAQRYGAVVIEDAAEALGATYKGCPIGRDGLAVLSFNGNKLVTTGGGGMLLTDDPAHAERARTLSNQEKLDGDALIYGAGFNYRMPNVNAAIGLAQMETLADRLASKRATAEYYQAHLPNVFTEQPWAKSSYWLPAILVDDAEETRERLARAGIEARRVWRPLSQQPHLKDCETVGGEIAADLYARGLTLPCSVGITDDDRARVVAALA